MKSINGYNGKLSFFFHTQTLFSANMPIVKKSTKSLVKKKISATLPKKAILKAKKVQQKSHDIENEELLGIDDIDNLESDEEDGNFDDDDSDGMLDDEFQVEDTKFEELIQQNTDKKKKLAKKDVLEEEDDNFFVKRGTKTKRGQYLDENDDDIDMQESKKFRKEDSEDEMTEIEREAAELDEEKQQEERDAAAELEHLKKQQEMPRVMAELEEQEKGNY